MHQRQHMRHNIQQAPMMRPHIPSQMNVSIGPHHQAVTIQQQAPPQQLQPQQPPPPNQQTSQQHPIMPQYITQNHPRTDSNRLGHHINPPQPQPPSSQQQQPQQQTHQSQQISQNIAQKQLQQPINHSTQRVSPHQMHQTHYIKGRPPNIINNNHGNVNLNNMTHPLPPIPQQPKHSQLTTQPSHNKQTLITNNIKSQHQASQNQKAQPIPQHQTYTIPIQQQSKQQPQPHPQSQQQTQPHPQLQQQSQPHPQLQQQPQPHLQSQQQQQPHPQPQQQSHSQPQQQQQPHPQPQQQQQPQQQHLPVIINNNNNNNIYNQKPNQNIKGSNIQNQRFNKNITGVLMAPQNKPIQLKHSVQTAHHLQQSNQNIPQQHQQSQVQVIHSQPTQQPMQQIQQTNNQLQPVNHIESNSTQMVVKSSNNSTNIAPKSNVISTNMVSTTVIQTELIETTTESITDANHNHVEQHHIVSADKNNVGIIINDDETSADEEPEIATNDTSVDDDTQPKGNTIVPSVENISSGKEKTPMCLVNELARYNQIQHQYRLIGEQGPAHSKKFTVILKLGEEEYTAEGLSIKKAQHTAAAEAITKTKYEHPPPKKIRHKNGSTRFGNGNITPTVELNALAMKLGEKAVYVFETPVGGQIPLTNANNGQNLPPINSTNFPPQIPINAGHPVIVNEANVPIQQPPINNCMPPGNVIQPTTVPPQMPNYYCADSNFQYGQFNSRNNLVNIYLHGNGIRLPNMRGRPFIRGGGGPFMKYRGRMISPFNGMPPVYQRDACKITLLVGKQKFTGCGPTVQAAKHDAASRALEVLKPIAENTNESDDEDDNKDESESDNKSPISQVYEIGLKRNMLVTFEIKSEIGPPHLKNFITICRVGDIATEGEGNGKKISKKRAAKKMLEELKNLPPLSPKKLTPQSSTYQNNGGKSNMKGNPRNPKRNQGGTSATTSQAREMKKRPKTVIKEKPVPENLDEMNPISRLIQIQQALKEREPQYTVVEEKGAPRRREFTIEASCNGKSAKGTGSNKKIAKRNAARNLLIVLGHEPDLIKENDFNVVNTVSGGSSICNESSDNNSNNISKNNQQNQNSSRQNVPSKNQENNETIKNQPNTSSESHSKSQLESESQVNESDNKAGDNESNDKNKNQSIEQKSSTSEFGVRPKNQLQYLAKILDLQLEFTDYPKGNHGEYLTILALFTEPPQLCHGLGENEEASQDSAALAALQLLTKLGLDNVKPKKANNNNNSTDENKKKTNDSG